MKTELRKKIDKMLDQLTAEDNTGRESSLSGMSGWQPIETAPKDGTLILIGKPAYCQIAKHECGWWVSQGGQTAYTGYTHWMPMPELPAE